MQLTSILQPTAVDCGNLTVKTCIDGMELDSWVYYYLQLADTLKYILKDIFICIIKEQCSDEGESRWRWYKGCQNTIHDILTMPNWIVTYCGYPLNKLSIDGASTIFGLESLVIYVEISFGHS